MNLVLASVLKAVLIVALGAIGVFTGSPLIQRVFRWAEAPEPTPPGTPAAAPPTTESPGFPDEPHEPAGADSPRQPAQATGFAAESPESTDGIPVREPSAAPSLTGGAPGAPTTLLETATDTLQGGRWIGMLERLAVYTSILTGFPEGIAIVLAVKGLARYPELKATTRGTAERFIIGTFASVLFAVACAGLSWWLIRLW